MPTPRRGPAGLPALMLLLIAVPVGATVEMQNQAKKLGFAVRNCLDCHASPHSVDVMKKKAQDLKMADGNCLACHGANIPAALNAKGEWLVAEKARRGARECDMAWLAQYKETKPASKPEKPAAKPEPVVVAPPKP